MVVFGTVVRLIGANLVSMQTIGLIAWSKLADTIASSRGG